LSDYSEFRHHLSSVQDSIDLWIHGDRMYHNRGCYIASRHVEEVLITSDSSLQKRFEMQFLQSLWTNWYVSWFAWHQHSWNLQYTYSVHYYIEIEHVGTPGLLAKRLLARQTVYRTPSSTWF
jgi:hypothetical protein